MISTKYLRFALLCVVVAMLAACTIEEGDSRPRKTQGAYAVYTNVYILHARAIENLRLVVGFDSYLHQSTEPERAAVAARFFPWAPIIVQKEYGWRIQDDELGNVYYDFIIKDGLLLDKPGASWTVYCRYSSSPGVNLMVDLANDGGEMHYKGYPFDDASVDWLVDVTLTRDDFAVEAGGESSYEYESDWPKSEIWTVNSRIGTPLRWADSKRCFFGGSMHVAALLASDSPRTIEFDAEQLSDGVRITTVGGITEMWSGTE